MRWVVMVALLSFGCAEEEPAPVGPIGGSAGMGGGAVGGGSRSDAGSDEDGGEDASVAVPGCRDVDADDPANFAMLRQDGEFVPFNPVASYAGWNPAPCDSETRILVASLSEDPQCQLGAGRRLVFLIDADEINGLIPVGAPVQIAFSAALQVLFIEPLVGEGEPVIMGNCEGSDGIITFDRLSDAAGSTISAAFSMTLSDCADVPTELPISLTGELTADLPFSFAELCTPLEE